MSKQTAGVCVLGEVALTVSSCFISERLVRMGAAATSTGYTVNSRNNALQILSFGVCFYHCTHVLI